MDCDLPGFPGFHVILQAKKLEWIAMHFSRGSSQLRDQTHISVVSCTAGRFFIVGATREAQMTLIKI